MSSEELIAQSYESLANFLQKQEPRIEAPASLSATELRQLSRFFELLKQWNTRINLVADASDEVLVERHITDSLAVSVLLCSIYRAEPGASYLDVGSGAGLPGVILQVMEPERHVVLLEPRGKRAVFLKQVKKELELFNTEVVCERLELLEKRSPAFGLVISRGFGQTAFFIEQGVRLLADQGLLIQAIGPNWDEHQPEIEAKLGLEFRKMNYALSLKGPERALAVWTVSRETVDNVQG